MNRIQKLVGRLPGRRSRGQNSEVVLGLPLESSGVTIYPVYLDSGAKQGNGTHPRQIGYLEISGDRSDFISLEPDYRVPLAAAAVTLLAVTIAWVTRRLMSDERRGNRLPRVSRAGDRAR